MIPPVFSMVQVLGVDEHMWHCQDRRRRDPRELTGIMTLTRGKDHPTARLSGPGSRKIWHRVQEQAGRARRAVSHQYPDHDTRPPPRGGGGSNNAIAWTIPRTPPASSRLSTSSRSPATPKVRCVAASSKKPWATADARVPPLLGPQSFARLTHAGSPPRQQERLRKAFVTDEMHISVEVAYRCAQQVREVFHQDTPTQSQHLAAHLIERLPTCPIPEIARPGQTLRKWKEALDAYIDTSGASNTSHRSHQRTLSNWADKTHRQRLPQPHQLPTPHAPHHRRPRHLPHTQL